MRVFEILKGTSEYELANKIFNWDKPFMEHINELSELLGIDATKDVGVTDWNLVMRSIPEGFQNQFKKHPQDGWYIAKKTSELNKKFLGFIAKHQIKRVGTAELSFRFLLNTIAQFHKLFDRYFLSLSPKVTDKALEVFAKESCLKEIQEVEFLRLKADYLEQNGNVRGD